MRPAQCGGGWLTSLLSGPDLRRAFGRPTLLLFNRHVMAHRAARSRAE